MWESGSFRRLREPEFAGSNPAIQTENGRASQLAMAAVSKTAEPRGLEGSTPSPSACGADVLWMQAARLHNRQAGRLHHSVISVSLAERQRRRSSKPDRRVRLPQDTLGDRIPILSSTA